MTASFVDVSLDSAADELAGAGGGDLEGGAELGRSVVGRVFTVLRAFQSDEMSMSLAELSARTGLAKGTLHRLCKQLVGEGIIERTKYGYRLGFRLAELGTRVVATSRLRELAVPFLQELSATTRGAAHLGILVGPDVYYLDSVYSHEAFAISARPGQRAPAHTTALGLALLARESNETCAEYARVQRLRRGWFEGELAWARTHGIASCRRGVQPLALGGAVLGAIGAPVCGISVVVPTGAALPRESAAALATAIRGLQGRLANVRLPGYADVDAVARSTA